MELYGSQGCLLPEKDPIYPWSYIFHGGVYLHENIKSVEVCGAERFFSHGCHELLSIALEKETFFIFLNELVGVLLFMPFS